MKKPKKVRNRKAKLFGSSRVRRIRRKRRTGGVK
jgi:hypothetical protein